MNLPGYDAWKLQSPYDLADEEAERAEYEAARDEYLADLADVLYDESRWDDESWRDEPDAWDYDEEL
jgi:hypothetical protein